MAKKERPAVLILLCTEKGKPRVVELFSDPRVATRQLQRQAGAFEYDETPDGRMYSARDSEGRFWSLHRHTV